MTLTEEKELLEKIKKDSTQFGILFDHYYKPIFGYVFRRVARYSLTQDIVAETFLKAFLKIKDFEWQGIPVLAWLYRIATNEVNYYFRKQKYNPVLYQSVLNPELMHFSTSVEEEAQLENELQEHEEFRIIQAQLQTLDTKYQEVIALRFFEKKDIKEISGILGKPEGTIKSLLSRGLEKLRNRLPDDRI